MIDRWAVAKVIERALAPSHADARDIAFHLTDWHSELGRFHQFCLAPDAASPEEIRDLLMDLLVHAPAHLAAAARLYTGAPVTDVFGIGAVDSSE